MQFRTSVIQSKCFSESRWENVGQVSSNMSGFQDADLGKNIGRMLEISPESEDLDKLQWKWIQFLSVARENNLFSR